MSHNNDATERDMLQDQAMNRLFASLEQTTMPYSRFVSALSNHHITHMLQPSPATLYKAHQGKQLHPLSQYVLVGRVPHTSSF